MYSVVVPTLKSAHLILVGSTEQRPSEKTQRDLSGRRLGRCALLVMKGFEC